MKKIGFAAGLIISAALLVLLFYKIDFAAFLASFKSANYWYLIPLILIILLGCYLRALRWYWIARPVKEMRVSNLFAATIIGYMANNLLPARAGEVIRAHVIGRMEGASRMASFATIIMERVFDGLSILLIMAVILPAVDLPMKKGLWAASGAALLLYIVVVLFALLINWRRDLADKLPWLESLAKGFEIIKQGHYLLIIFLYSLLIWVVTAYGVYLSVISFNQQFSYLASMIILVLLTFAVMIPSSPGFVGTFDAAMVYGLILFKIPREAALSTAVFFHGMNFIPMVLLGFFYLWKYGLSLREN